MQHLAVRTDREQPDETKGRYVYQRDIPCTNCNVVSYQLWSPELETEDEAVRAQSAWLNTYLPTKCPDHPWFFLTPDRPEI